MQNSVCHISRMLIFRVPSSREQISQWLILQEQFSDGRDPGKQSCTQAVTPRQNHVRRQINNRSITCVADLIQECTKLGAHQTDCLLYYRGEETNKWKLRPSVMRPLQKSQFSLCSKESTMLLDLMSRRPEDFHNTTSAFAQWVLAQHHGLKTRLLDVTRNPLVALFYACDNVKKIGRLHVFSVPRDQVKSFNSDTISVIANFSKLSRAEQNLLLGWTGEDIVKRESDPKISYIYKNAMRRLYHFIRQEKPIF